jgi:cobyrinic acid a,c-diamide synthase
MSEYVYNRLCRTCIIAAPESGSGKTVITLGILRALINRGYRVQPFKTGPDYLDGTWHTVAAKRNSYNLDTWMIDRALLIEHFHSLTVKCEYAVIEGVMGLYDGFEGTIDGSTADLAMSLDIPVVLVIDCKCMSGSVAPIVYGFKHFNDTCRISGVILNNTGSEGHEAYLREAMKNVNVPVLGCIPRNDKMVLNHRHLGLVTAENGSETDRKMDEIASVIENHVDLDNLCKILECRNTRTDRNYDADVHFPARCRIAVAKDAAFHFYYQANLDLLIKSGAELVYFSPLSDKKLPLDIQGVYLGGGYPELYVQQLSENESMRNSIIEFADNYGCVYAECGGYMYLGFKLLQNGISWPMCGVFDNDFEMNNDKRMHLGYRSVTLRADSFLGKSGLSFRGHEFHYSNFTGSEIVNPPFTIATRSGSDPIAAGSHKKNVLASYVHVHFLSCPELAENFVNACIKIKS